MEKKYKLTEETINVCGRTLHRIEALKDFGDVKKGDKGGFIENEENLYQRDDCWVYGDAKVYDNAIVFDNAKVCDNAVVCGYASIYDKAEVFGKAMVYDKAEIYGDREVHGNEKSVNKQKTSDRNGWGIFLCLFSNTTNIQTELTNSKPKNKSIFSSNSFGFPWFALYNIYELSN